MWVYHTFGMNKSKSPDGPLVVLLVVNGILLLVLLGVTIVLRLNRDGLNETQGMEQTLCEPCTNLTMDGTIPTGCQRNGVDKCCCEASVAITALVKKTAKEKHPVFNSRRTSTNMQLEPECGYGKKASGKVSGIDYDSLKKDTRERELVYWEKSEQSILDLVRYTNGRFTIDQPGYYYVFSQLKYEHDPESSQNRVARQTHTLHHYSLRTREQKLLENSRSFAELHSLANNGTSFFASVFKFERNDKIMIKTSHTHRISGSEKENFFGLHIL